MAVRAANTCGIFRSAASASALSLPAFRCRRRTTGYRPLGFRKHFDTVICFSNLEPGLDFGGFGTIRRFSAFSLVDSIMEEFKALRKTKRVRAFSEPDLTISTEHLEGTPEKQRLRKGLLLEYKRDSERVLLAVSQKPDGKRNWMAYDQNGVASSLKPQKITYVVPGVENFEHSEIEQFIQQSQDYLDPALLEFAWSELHDKNKSVVAEELAEMIFGSSEPLKCYCAHHLLSSDEIYFSVLERKGSRTIYFPRSSAQVDELISQKLLKEAAEKEFQEFIHVIKSAKAVPISSKPCKSKWIEEEKTRKFIESLEAFAIDSFKTDEQKRIAGEVLNAMGITKMPSSVINLLIDIGYFPVHVNVDLLKSKIRTNHSDVIVSAAESLLADSGNVDEVNRKDLTHLKVYAIDVDEADELDDALSATRLHDGRIKVWIHVADPASLVRPGSLLDMEARKRGASLFLPTATYPMFPEKLAMEGMSLKQGQLCKTVTVSVVLNADGSIAEYSVDNTTTRPTYMLTYESASKLLRLNLEEEAELRILSEAATLRSQWRRLQGSAGTSAIEARIKVINPEDPEPQINLYVEDQANPAMRLVSEMMILCGEVIATFGSCNNLPLPYRGHSRTYTDIPAFSHLPEGPIRSAAIVKTLGPTVMDFRRAKRHGVLGVPGYVQFTSPIRRYVDLLAHYQVKAFLRGEDPPFSAGNLEGLSSAVTIQFKHARQLAGSSVRYWTLEYLRRQPREKRFQALVLRFFKDRLASLLLTEVVMVRGISGCHGCRHFEFREFFRGNPVVGFQANAKVSTGVKIGDTILVSVEEAHPRNNVLTLKEVVVQ